jgi:hypothetical protein
MVDEVAEHRLKAEACRRLADLSKEDTRKALWPTIGKNSR